MTKERPDLEEEKSFLIKQQNEFKIKLKELEAGLLRQARPPRRDTSNTPSLPRQVPARYPPCLSLLQARPPRRDTPGAADASP